MFQKNYNAYSIQEAITRIRIHMKDEVNLDIYKNNIFFGIFSLPH